MADVFVSYAHKDEARARQVAEALSAQGYRAWRDDELPAHRSYGEVIEERLNSAQAVVVLWSSDAKASQWVRAEADTARNRGTLIQASLDGTIPPIPFNQIQCADLNGAGAPVDSPGWSKLMGSVQALAGSVAQPDARRSRRQRVSVCVLPFANMSGDPEFEAMIEDASKRVGLQRTPISGPALPLAK